MLQKAFILIVCFSAGLITTAWSQQQEDTNVRLTRIEESIKAMNQRMEELNKATHQRIDDTIVNVLNKVICYVDFTLLSRLKVQS